LRGYQARIDFVSRKILQIPFAPRRGNGPQQVLLLAHRDLASKIHVRNAADCVAKLGEFCRFALPRIRPFACSALPSKACNTQGRGLRLGLREASNRR